MAEMLQRMEQQSAAVRPCAVEIAAALSRDEYPAALEASAELHRALDALVATTELLEDHVVAHDGMGELGESVGELALRARAMVLAAQFDLLCEALREPAAQARAHGWFVGRFQGITETAVFVRERLNTIHAIWVPYRQSQPQPPGMTDTDRVSIYRTAVRVAQRALCELRDEPELAQFLNRGATATDLPDVHSACKRILGVLGLHIDVEPGGPPTPRPRRFRVANGRTERR
jgi:hypothetical protein